MYALGIEPNGRVFVMEQSTDIPNAWIILLPYGSVTEAQEALERLEQAEAATGLLAFADDFARDKQQLKDDQAANERRNP
jgi:hypothetical protein